MSSNMSSDQEAERDWIAKVLGVKLLGAPASGVAALPSGTVAFAKMQLRWRDAQNRVRAELNRLAASLLAHPGVQADPRLPQVKAVAAELPTMVPKFGGVFEDVLNDVINAGGISPPLAERGESALAGYRGALARAPALAELEAFAGKHFKLDLKLFTDLDETLVALLAEFKRSGAAAASRS